MTPNELARAYGAICQSGLTEKERLALLSAHGGTDADSLSIILTITKATARNLLSKLAVSGYVHKSRTMGFNLTEKGLETVDSWCLGKFRKPEPVLTQAKAKLENRHFSTPKIPPLPPR